MPTALRVIPAALLAGCGSVTSHAPPAERDYFDCDVPPGHFSEWHRTVRGDEVRVSGTFAVIEPRQDERWGSVASVFITGNNSMTVGFRAFIDARAPELVRVVPMGPAGPVWSDALLSKPWHGEAIPFALSISHSGELSVSVADKSRSQHLSAFGVQKVELSCSTGQFTFADVTIDTAR